MFDENRRALAGIVNTPVYAGYGAPKLADAA
jgi:hypothetical protein